MTSRQKSNVGAAIALVIMTLVLYWALDDYFSIPTVYRSWSTKECVKVEGCDCDCDSLPDRAHTVWVQ